MNNLNPIAIVTGASTGIGEQISIKLSKKNFHIVLISRSKERLEKVKDKIELFGGQCQIIVADLSKSDITSYIKKQIKTPDNIEILVNNAGIGFFDKLEDISIDDWNQQINTNLRGSFLMTQFVSPFMIKNKTGKILFVNSVAGLSPYPFASAYVASKYALRGFASSLREEFREHNIKVISVHPGAVDTPLWDKSKADFLREEMLSSEDVSDMITKAIMAPNNIVCEEIILRRTAGDF
ncbi:MAG: hypothetical protein CMG66_04585 [Candidatus Marinimicrobia bacterium]|nr:hypothetical protein [Candidatus Neomarinimicrobiota bacterium]|tara:strand:- start:1892 stop:2605 length:714 start_codon:yes stop_codon:yes gene_type:complete